MALAGGVRGRLRSKPTWMLGGPVCSRLWVPHRDSASPEKKVQSLKFPIPDSKAKYPLLSAPSLSRKLSLRGEMNKRLALQGRGSTEGKGDPLNLL